MADDPKAHADAGSPPLTETECALVKITPEEFLFFNRQLASLCRLDVPIAEGLEALSGEVKTRDLGSLVDQVLREVTDGTRLSAAVRKFPRVFPDLYVGLIEAGEEAGSLPRVLESLGDYSLSTFSVRRKMQTAFVYPLFVISLVTLITILFTLVILPTLGGMYKRFSQEMSVEMPALFAIAQFLGDHRFELGAGMVLAFLGIWLLTTLRWPRILLGALAMNLPLIGAVARHGANFLFCRTLALLLQSGVPVARSLGLMERVFTRGVLHAVCRDMHRAAENGERISDEARRGGFFPHTMVWKLALGERKGDLLPSLEELALYYEAETQLASERFHRLVPPMLVMLIGAYVGLCYLAILYPIIALIIRLA